MSKTSRFTGKLGTRMGDRGWGIENRGSEDRLKKLKTESTRKLSNFTALFTNMRILKLKSSDKNNFIGISSILA